MPSGVTRLGVDIVHRLLRSASGVTNNGSGVNADFISAPASLCSRKTRAVPRYRAATTLAFSSAFLSQARRPHKIATRNAAPVLPPPLYSYCLPPAWTVRRGLCALFCLSPWPHAFLPRLKTAISLLLFCPSGGYLRRRRAYLRALSDTARRTNTVPRAIVAVVATPRQHDWVAAGYWTDAGRAKWRRQNRGAKSGGETAVSSVWSAVPCLLHSRAAASTGSAWRRRYLR